MFLHGGPCMQLCQQPLVLLRQQLRAVLCLRGHNSAHRFSSATTLLCEEGEEKQKCFTH